MKGGLKRRGRENVDPRDTPLQHLQRDGSAFEVIYVLGVPIAHVDDGVPRRRGRGRPVSALPVRWLAVAACPVVGIPNGQQVVVDAGGAIGGHAAVRVGGSILAVLESSVIGTPEMKKPAEFLVKGGLVCAQRSASGADPVRHRFRAA